MKRQDIEGAQTKILKEYGKVLEATSRRTYGVPESRLPYSKEEIKETIKAALLNTDDEDQIEHLKASYLSLANFIPDDEANRAEEIPPDLFSFLEMEETRKKEFLRARFKTGLLGDYEIAVKITSKIAEEQKDLRREIEEFIENKGSR